MTFILFTSFYDNKVTQVYVSFYFKKSWNKSQYILHLRSPTSSKSRLDEKGTY